MEETETEFAVYLESRDDVPTADESHQEGVDFNTDEIEPDKVITGYNNLSDFLDENQKTVTAEIEEFGEVEYETGMYRWSELNVDDAPIHEFCHCGAEIQTRSKERVGEVSSCHHIGTGH
jgi:hypothetical protein